MNVTAGYWEKSGGTKDVSEYLREVEEAGFYGVIPFDGRLKGHPALLGYIQDDEPDLTHPVNDAEVVAGPGMHVNPNTPLWKLVDGVTHSWSVLDPLAGATVTIRLKQQVTAESLAVWQTVSLGLSVAKDVALSADGQEILRDVGGEIWATAVPSSESGSLQGTPALGPVGLSGERNLGSLGEIEAFDRQGKNVLLSPPRDVPRAMPAEVIAKYKRIKEADPNCARLHDSNGRF